jgi:hypothetical protein
VTEGGQLASLFILAILMVKESQRRAECHIPSSDSILFHEVVIKDASGFSADLQITGVELDCARILSVEATAVPNSVAGSCWKARHRTGLELHVYFVWSEGNLLVNLLEFLFVCEGEIATVSREIIRRAVPNPANRPHAHS